MSMATSLLVTTTMWMLMMTVMMAPSTLPWLSGFAAMSRDQKSGAMRRGWVALFGLGYLTVWGGFSVVAASLQMWLGDRALLEGSLAVPAPLGALFLVGAGLYRLLHVSVGDGEDVCSSLGPGDDSCLALEASVRHSLLLGSIKHDRDAVAIGVGEHHSVDENAAALGLLLLENAASALACAVCSLSHQITFRP